MPATATLALVAAAAMAGVPLLNGFLSKEMFFAATIFAADRAVMNVLLPAAATVAGMFSVAYSLRFIHQVFFGPPARDLPRTPSEPTRLMLLPSALLVLACLLVGTLPARTIGPVLEVATRSILGADTPTYSLAVWHGLTMPLLMSVLALVGGVVIYRMLVARRGAHRPSPLRNRFGGTRRFEVITVSTIRAAGWAKRLLSTRRLQPQLAWIVLTSFAAAYVALSRGGLAPGSVAMSTFDPVFALMWLLGAACAIGAANQAKYHRLATLIMVGGTGLITCLTFGWFSAPDLALTQITVEVVTLVLILLGLRWLPRRTEIDDVARRSPRARARRARDFVISVVVGIGVAAVTFAVLTRPPVTRSSAFFLEHSLSTAGGRNVVNVILVDFRAFDTFGEITVVAIVALTVYALLRRSRPAPESIEVPRARREDAAPMRQPDEVLPSGYLMVPAVLVRLLLPMAALVSVFFLLRGHNAPGGGFVGGLVLVTAALVQYIVGSATWVESRTRIHPPYWIAIGLLASGIAGVSAWFASKTFLTSLAWDLHLPLLGELHVSTTLLFDVGVYMLVVGATVLILIAIAHQSLRSSQRNPIAAADATDPETLTVGATKAAAFDAESGA